MQLIKVGVAALNQTPLDWRGNTQRILDAIHLARDQRVQILTLPELALSGYGCEDAFFAPDTTDQALLALQMILPHSKGLIVNVGLPIRHQGALFNCVAVLCDGQWVGLIPKKILAGDGVHYEHRWFKEWPESHVDTFTIIQGQATVEVPMGDFYFQWNGIRFGYEICEEAWVARRPGARLAEQSIDFIFNPSASHFAFGKNEVRKRFVLEGSRAFSCVYVYSNLVGNESGRIIFDGSLMIASHGEMITEAERFSFADVQLITSVIDININRTRRTQTSSFRPALEAGTLRGITLESTMVPTQIQDSLPTRPSDSRPITSKNEEFQRAVSLALFDYLRKSYSQGFAISLSGGIDSSVVTVLCASALRLAESELGLDAVKQKLSHIRQVSSASSVADIIGAVIHCVYQSTQNSSAHTRCAAETLAKALGVTYSEWSIESIKTEFETTIAKTLGRPLQWNQDDLALQNIQARVRAPGIWLLANVKGLLLLATSNRSEAAVGYATMDGDTAGGLSPIAGVDKAFLGQWIRWKAEDKSSLLGPIPELQLVYQIPPTAELRPLQVQQTDESDLMPYPVLDFIERHLLINRLKPMDIFNLLTSEFSNYQKAQLRDWVVRFLKLWVQNQWKRERFAPAFHLDSESLDPKTWCRFPILSKAFSLDIEELNQLKL
jgi:NAD+ synthase (glutamine-hydrolysing)